VANEKYNVLQHRSIGHYTHEKNGLCSAAGLAMIQYLQEHELAKQADEVGRHALQWLERMKDRHRLVGHIYGLGLHIGIEMVKDKRGKEKAIAEAETVMYKAMERGIAFKVIEGNVITLRPSLLITWDEMVWALEQIEACIQEVENALYY
jgi:4-aminobutyrate aminotransferase